MAHAKAGELWITLQVHVNIVAVASLNDLAGIIIVNGREPEEATLRKAREEGVLLMVTPCPPSRWLVGSMNWGFEAEMGLLEFRADLHIHTSLSRAATLGA